MATAMGPPMVPAFSLRVQLFSPNAHELNDKPLRSFRVVSSSEATVRDFCIEASRIHEINYGEPIAIKKCQDDQEFDITQTEILGSIFASADTIRVIQASANPGVRDSIPPTSALRFDHTTNSFSKRGREESAGFNGSMESSIYRPIKRQRVSDLDPDQPLPSRESDPDEDGHLQDEVVPNSQREAAHMENEHFRHIRDDPLRISETPSPPPEVIDFAQLENASADGQREKLKAPNSNDPFMHQISIPSPFEPDTVLAQNLARSKSASYHIQRATERGSSVSTAATSPPSGDQQGSVTDGGRSSNRRKISDSILELPKINGKTGSQSPNEDIIYGDLPSDDRRSAVLRKTKDKLKSKNRSPSGSASLDWAQKFDTPPNGSRRTSHSQDPIISSGELPLTPNSKQHQERLHQNGRASDTRKARIAATDATERQKRREDRVRDSEEQERIRKLREKSEREAQEKRNVVISKAAQLEKSRLEQMERDHRLNEEREAEKNRLDQERIQIERDSAESLERERQEKTTKESKEAANLALKQASIEKEMQAARKLEQEKVEAEEAEQFRLTMAEMRRSREKSEKAQASSPDQSRATPIRPPQSSTAFVPSGRKSALKTPSSQAGESSSPELQRTVSTGSCSENKHSLEAQRKVERRVSFDTNVREAPKQTPIRTPILPPPRASASNSLPAFKAPSRETSAMVKKDLESLVNPVRKVTTPIIPPVSRIRTAVPSSAPQISKQQIARPVIKSAIIPPGLGITNSAAIKHPTSKSVSPPTSSTSQNSEKSDSSAKSEKPIKPAVQVTISSHDETDEEEDEDDEDLDDPIRINPVMALNNSLRSPAKTKQELKPTPRDQDDGEEYEDEDVQTQEIQSNRTSSRSPILFNSNNTLEKAKETRSAESATSASDDSHDEDDSAYETDSTDSEEESSEEEDENKTFKPPLPRSSPPSIVTTQSQGKTRQSSSTVVKSTPTSVPSSIATPRPKINFGASLLSLAKQSILGSSVSKANSKAQPLNLTNNDEEESEENSEEESNSDSSTDSDIEKELSQILPKPRQFRASEAESDDSVSDSGSDSDMKNESDADIHRNELAARIAKMASESLASAQSFNFPSPKISLLRSSAGDVNGKVKAAKEGSAKHDKYLKNYSFSQPK